MKVWRKSCKREENIEMFASILYYHLKIGLDLHPLVHSEAVKDKFGLKTHTLTGK